MAGTPDTLHYARPELIETPCPGCGADVHVLLFRCSDRLTRTTGFEVARCLQCSLVYTRRRPPADQLSFFYPAEYYNGMARPLLLPPGSSQPGLARRILVAVYAYPEGISSTPPGRVESWLLRLATWLTRRDAGWVPWVPGGRLLDVGAGCGTNTASYASLGWSTVGVEYSVAAAAVGRSAGLDIREGTLADQRFSPASFDGVLVNHVLEHVENPRATLLEFARILRPGGWLVIRLPNVDAWGSWVAGPDLVQWSVPRHLVHFSPQTLAAMLRSCGFSVARSRVEWRPSELGAILAIVAKRHPWLPTRILNVLLQPVLLAATWLRRGASLAVQARRVATGAQ